jgi:hypothetical protein
MSESKCHANFIFGYVQKKMNEMNKVNERLQAGLVPSIYHYAAIFAILRLA